MTQEPSLRTKMVYGAGGFGQVLFWCLTTYFLMYYFTEVVGLPPSTASAILLVATLVNGATDFLVGVLADRSERRDARRYQQFIGAALPFLALGSILTFFAPSGLGDDARAAYVLGALLVMLSAYSFVNIPYSAILSVMSDDSLVRARVAGFKASFKQLAAFTVAVATLPLVHWLGGGDETLGFRYTAMVYGAVGTVAVGLCAVVHIPGKVPKDGTALPVRVEHTGFREIYRFLALNGPLWIVLGATFLWVVGQGMVFRAAAYYAKYFLGDARMASWLLGVVAAGAVSIPGWVQFARRTSKRATWIACSVTSASALALLVLLEPGASPVPVVAGFALTSIGLNGFAMNSHSILADTLEYGEWKSGIRCQAFVFALLTMTFKLAAGLSAVVLGLVLQAAGVAGGGAVSPDALVRIEWMTCAIPAGMFALSAALVSFFPIDARMHRQIVEALALR